MSRSPIFEPFDESNQRLQREVAPADWRNPQPASRYHLVVVGGGTAGLVAAAGAAGLGARVALIEQTALGGDCLLTGCVPSKALLSQARKASALRCGSAESAPDFASAMDRMRRLRSEISPHDSAVRFQALGVDIFFGTASFASPTAVEVGGRRLNFSRALIATGSRAAIPDLPGLAEARPLTHETLFSLTDLPRRILILGGGPVGCEMAQALRRFGAEVTVVEQASRILPRDDSEAAGLVQAALEREGVRFLLASRVERFENRGLETLAMVSGHGPAVSVSCDRVLVAAGRQPNINGLGLELAEVETDPRSGIRVNDWLQTSNRRIYAAGDVCSAFRFTHAADFQSRIVVRNALFGGRARVSRLLVPWCTFTSPELAHVGLLPEPGRESAFRSMTIAFERVDRSILEEEPPGFVRLHCARRGDRILGATVVSPQAGELIGELTLAIQHRIGLRKIAATLHAYPTRADAIRKLGDDYNRTRLTPLVKWLMKSWLRWLG